MPMQLSLCRRSLIYLSAHPRLSFSRRAVLLSPKQRCASVFKAPLGPDPLCSASSLPIVSKVKLDT